jgi:hypothetical protein
LKEFGLSQLWFGLALANHRGPAAYLTAESIGHDEIAVNSRLNSRKKRWPLYSILTVEKNYWYRRDDNRRKRLGPTR